MPNLTDRFVRRETVTLRDAHAVVPVYRRLPRSPTFARIATGYGLARTVSARNSSFRQCPEQLHRSLSRQLSQKARQGEMSRPIRLRSAALRGQAFARHDEIGESAALYMPS